MDCAAFRKVLFAWMDGELHGEQEREAAEHVSACARCRSQAEAERAFDGRVVKALKPEGDVALVQEMLRRARPGGQVGPVSPLRVVVGPRRLLQLPRVWGSMAASIAALVGLGWLLCVPPFECPYLQAVEEAAMMPAPKGGMPGGMPSMLAGRVRVPDALLGHAPKGPATAVPVVLMGMPVDGLRAQYDFDGTGVSVVWSDAMGELPSFRRRVTREGREWWLAYEGGQTIVAYMSKTDRALCSVVGPLPEEKLLEAASALRAKAP